MTITDFLLARTAEEEQAWRELAARSRDDVPLVELRLLACLRKRRTIEAYLTDGGTFLLRQLQDLALPYYRHPDYNDVWRPPNLPRRAG